MTGAPLRVLQVLDSLQVGGKERVAVDLANGLAERGWDSRILASRSTGTLGDEVGPDVKLWCAERRGRWDFKAIKRIARYLDDERIDIVHSHNPFSSYLTRVVLWFARARPLHVAHGHFGPAVKSRKIGLLNWLMLRHVAAYIGVSQELRDRARRLLPLSDERCIFLRNGIPIPPEAPPFTGRPTVIQVANVHARKDYTMAVRAAGHLRESVPDLRWRCVGTIGDPPTPYVQEVRALIDSLGLSDCVELLGQRTDISELLCEANVGVLTSRAEGLPLSMLEYMAASLPVVTTAVGQGPDILREADAGRVVPVGDHEAAAEALAGILTDGELRARLGRNARNHVSAHYSLARMVEEVCSFYERLLADAGPGR
jgi:glycosyltransferase involved in cell wall biosynthesis